MMTRHGPQSRHEMSRNQALDDFDIVHDVVGIVRTFKPHEEIHRSTFSPQTIQLSQSSASLAPRR
jgi:hypothetical protein